MLAKFLILVENIVGVVSANNFKFSMLNYLLKIKLINLPKSKGYSKTAFLK